MIARNLSRRSANSVSVFLLMSSVIHVHASMLQLIPISPRFYTRKRIDCELISVSILQARSDEDDDELKLKEDFNDDRAMIHICLGCS